jgi:hypothetical protein
MKRNILRCVVVCIVTALAVTTVDRIDRAFAQQPGGGGGFGGEGGVGGAGGAGGAGGGYGGLTAGGAIASFGEYVYVLRQETLYQFAAYDLTLVKKVNLDRAARKRGGGRGGAGGAAGQGGAGGRGGDGGGGSPGTGSVTAHGDYVYVLRDATVYKFVAKGLKMDKTVTLDFGDEEE